MSAWTSRSRDRALRGHLKKLRATERELFHLQALALKDAGWETFRVGDWVEGQKLGSGGFGDVYLYSSRLKEGLMVVVKKLAKTSISYETIQNELATLRYLRSVCGEYIVCFHSFGMDDQYFYLASKPIRDATDMDNLIAQTKSFSPNHLNRIIGNTIFGLFLLHVRNVAHVDVKPDNLLVDDRLRVYYIDFGGACLGKVFCRGESSTFGTDFYLPPESLTNSLPEELSLLKQYDAWALGITIYSLLNGGQTPAEEYLAQSQEQDEGKEEDVLDDYLERFRYNSKDKVSGKSNEQVEARLKRIGRTLKFWLERDPAKRPVAVLEPFPAWRLGDGNGYLTPDGRRMRQKGRKWHDPQHEQQQKLLVHLADQNVGGDEKESCARLMCSAGIFDRPGFRRWAQQNHPDKCTASKKSTCSAKFSLLNQCSQKSFHCPHK